MIYKKYRSFYFVLSKFIHGFHLITSSVAWVYFFYTQLIFYILSTIFSDFYLPMGFSAKLAINCTLLSTVSDILSFNLFTISSNEQKLSIYILPWFNCDNEHNNKQIYLRTC